VAANVNINFVIDHTPSLESIQFLEDEINAFNVQVTGVAFGGSLACFIREESGEIKAGLYGWTWGDCCEIRLLWVRTDLRRQGLGSQLLQIAEEEASKRGCRQVVLETHSFQAPEFYLSKGYEIAGVIEGYPYQYRKFYLRKHL
jgi:GNAT superfamily N-acetyltransferase